MFELHHKLAADCWYLGDFPLCALLLARDANYPWFILVPRVPDIEEIYQLDASQRSQLMDESCLLAEILQRDLGAAKMNIAALGNMVPQLHIHHIARRHDDAAWPGPIWGVVPPLDYAEGAAHALKERLAGLLPADRFSWREVL